MGHLFGIGVSPEGGSASRARVTATLKRSPATDAGMDTASGADSGQRRGAVARNG